MRKVLGFSLLLITLFLFSCSEKNQFPEKKSEKFPTASVTENQLLFKNEFPVANSLAQQILNPEIQQLKNFVSKYENRDKDFSVEKMEALWGIGKNKLDLTGLESISAWIEATGFLLEITGKPVYAEALQQLSSNAKIGLSEQETKLVEQTLAPYVFTKNVDHIFVNLFVNSSVEYVHSLDRKVGITLESKGSDGFLLKFNMDEKRYIEVNILMPKWAVNATVTEKNVKYVANPGEYCLIARKWKEGDFVEVKY